MRLLIDTQAFIWLINGDKRLGAKTQRLLNDTSNQIYISYFSFFEMTIKASIGKLAYDNSVIDDLPTMGIELVLPNKDILENYSIFNPENRDPFDNVLMAVAINEKCTFVTADPKILAVSDSGLILQDATR
jgi:PIN domain nuclease of toxin-antitoxin system